MLNNSVFETLLKIANRYNLQLKCSYDETYCNHFLIAEKKSVFINHFIKKTYRNRLYVDVTPCWANIEIYRNENRLCRMKIYKKTELAIILKKIEQYSRDCHDYCDFLYSLAIYLKKKG